METAIKSNNFEVSDNRDVQETISLHNTILSNEENLISLRQSNKKRKVRTKISKAVAKLLYEWISSHEDYPYPSSNDLELLKQSTQLTEKQIRIWFTNYRNRKLSPTTSCLSKIKYTLLHKNEKEVKSCDSRKKVIKEASVEYLHRYFCH
mmetsp:Transcript_39058/g.44684  ORF Transcript_39058/g.44684 Transcript_39058/m.44684 type:complete len:150 (+) Transcript_39058:16-465(+)